MIARILQTGMISILTQIGLDHLDILGGTIEEIAKKKAGIIKKNADTVMCIQKPEIVDIVKSTCDAKRNFLHLIKEAEIENYRVDSEFQYFDYGIHKNIALNLKGKCQIYNASEVLCTIDILRDKGYDIDEEALRRRI